MPAPNHQRTEIGPLSVRMSVAERGEARRKARALRVHESEFMRIAAAEYDVDAALERRRRTFHEERPEVADAQPGDLTVAYDADEAHS